MICFLWAYCQYAMIYCCDDDGDGLEDPDAEERSFSRQLT